MSGKRIEIGILIYPGMTQLDVTGPFEVLARLPNVRVHLLWKRIEPVVSDVGLTVLPTTTFADCPELEVFCIGGGPGMVEIMDDDELIAFVRDKGGSARYITSVCAGCLILGAAGLLDGYKSACHWLMSDQLAAFGAIAVDERVVIDRNRISGGGVTAGVDFGFQVASELCGEDVARQLQLMLEYQPQPPFDITVQNAPPELISRMRVDAEPWLRKRAAAVEKAAAKLKSKAKTAA
ncbi:MAG: DJ-1/PfpI family protein [Pseudomonadota bacterium]